MSKATMTSKGQVTVPKEVRDDLGLTPGAVLTFARQPNGDYVLSTKPRGVAELKGWFEYSGAVKSIEEMNEAIAAAAGEERE